MTAPQRSGTVHIWEHLTRARICDLAESATVIVPLGAIEQHGPHLPTGTDSLLVAHAVDLAAGIVADRTGRDLLLADFLRIGSSDHHLPFGGTISLPPATFLLVLTDALRSMAHSGVRRITLVNGHGGNTGVCHAAAAAVSTGTTMSVAVVDYWDALATETGAFPIPGHAGRWESALVRAVRPELFVAHDDGRATRPAKAPGRGIYGADIWAAIDGYTDEPQQSSAAEGAAEWHQIAATLADRLVAVIEAMG